MNGWKEVVINYHMTVGEMDSNYRGRLSLIRLRVLHVHIAGHKKQYIHKNANYFNVGECHKLKSKG